METHLKKCLKYILSTQSSYKNPPYQSAFHKNLCDVDVHQELSCVLSNQGTMKPIYKSIVTYTAEELAAISVSRNTFISRGAKSSCQRPQIWLRRFGSMS